KEQLKNFGAIVQNDLIVQDGNIITSSNPGTAFDVAFLLLEKLTSKKNAEHVKDLMGF
ncbi:TPA: DJ-1 family protein, partial [Bacillus thuringiensis]|nr:DJ-1 family protein [Bacillus thuringiensis]